MKLAENRSEWSHAHGRRQPESLWLEVYGAASQATEEIFDYALGWAACKGLPPGQTREINW